jgi:hypothetical protein
VLEEGGGERGRRVDRRVEIFVKDEEVEEPRPGIRRSRFAGPA